MAASFTKLTNFPRHRLIDDEVARCRASELDLLALFGEAPSHAPGDDPDPTFFWDVEWSCGLVMDLQFHQLSEMLAIRLDESDVEHALRHLAFEVRDLWVLEEQDPQRFEGLARPLARRSEVWERDADGDIRALAKGLTERDATCWRDELTDQSPGTQYWVTAADA